MSRSFEFTLNGIAPMRDTATQLVLGESDDDEAFTVPASGYAGAMAGPPSAPNPTIKTAPRAETKPLKKQSLIGMCKARLKELNREIKRLKALEKERDEVERLLAAATEKKPTNVSAIRRAI